MKAHARASFIRQSPTKVRLVLDLVRGLPVERARETLAFTNRRASELRVVEAFADEGPVLKRFRPRARGRATQILKRTSHITIVVGDGKDEESA